MATPVGGNRPFPALPIAFLLLLVALFAGQYWLPAQLPGISGRASLNVSLIFLDRSIHLPIAIDLILVPALFIIGYTLISILYPAGRTTSVARSFTHRLGSAFSAIFLLLVCVTIAGLISYMLDDYLPRDLRKGLDTMGMSADLFLQGYKPAHLQGNIIALLGLVAGIVIAAIRLNQSPLARKTTPLTPEQRMTPYQRMLQERKQNHLNPPSPAQKPSPVSNSPAPATSNSPRTNNPPTTISQSPANSRPARAITRRPLCFNQPLPIFEPEAVNYRPL